MERLLVSSPTTVRPRKRGEPIITARPPQNLACLFARGRRVEGVFWPDCVPRPVEQSGGLRTRTALFRLLALRPNGLLSLRQLLIQCGPGAVRLLHFPVSIVLQFLHRVTGIAVVHEVPGIRRGPLLHNSGDACECKFDGAETVRNSR